MSSDLLPHDLSDDGPRYEAIARLLLEAMTNGTYPVGSLIPTEAELATQFAVSRQTVRAAMRELQELGAISRRKGIGTRVEPRQPSKGSFQQSLGSLDDLMRYAEETRRSLGLVDRVVMDRRMAALYGCEAGSRWLHIVYVRMPLKAGAPPVGYTDVYIDERFERIEPLLAEHKGLYSDLIEQLYGVAVDEVSQDVRAIGASGPASDALGFERGAPALEVVRRYFDRSRQLIEFTISLHPANSYAIKTSMTRVRGTA